MRHRTIGIQGLNKFNKVCSEVCKDAPITTLISMRQCRLINILLDSQMIQTILVSIQAEANISQTVSSSELSEKELSKLIPTIQPSCSVIAVVTLYTFTKLITVYKR